MALTASRKVRVRRALHRAYCANELPILWTKPEVDAVITDADNWLDSVAVDFNSALSQPFRGTAGATDKSVLLIAITIAQRLVSEPAYISVLKNMLSEIDGIDGD